MKRAARYLWVAAAAVVGVAGCSTPRPGTDTARPERAPHADRSTQARPAGPGTARPAAPDARRPAARPAPKRHRTSTFFLKVGGPPYNVSGFTLHLKMTGHKEEARRVMWGVYNLRWTAGGKSGELEFLVKGGEPMHWYGETRLLGWVVQLLGSHPQGVKIRLKPGAPKVNFDGDKVSAVVAKRIGMKRFMTLTRLSVEHRPWAYDIQSHRPDGTLVLRMIIGPVTGAVLYQWLAKSVTAKP